MRINQFIAAATGLSRRKADQAVAAGRVKVNGEVAVLGQNVGSTDSVTLDNSAITPPVNSTTIMLNKPVGYVCSRHGQGSPTVYDLLPAGLRGLKPVGRLDKDSSGLLLLTNDGRLAHRLAHPGFQKTKVYEVVLDRPLKEADRQAITAGVKLDDGPSKLKLEPLNHQPTGWRVSMHEGRNRQIRRTFAALGYAVVRLHRLAFGRYKLGDVASGSWIKL